MFRITETVKHLLIINFIAWLATITIGSNGVFMTDLFALHFPANPLFEPWQILTHMFMHASYVPGGGLYFQHILFNMFALWMFGTSVEQALGKRKFLFFYISVGLGAALITLGIDYIRFFTLTSELSVNIDSAVLKEILTIDAGDGKGYLRSDIFLKGLEPIMERYNLGISNADFQTLFRLNAEGFGFKTMLGASGAIMGVLVAFAMMFPESQLMLIFLPIPIKAKYFIPAIIALDLFSALTGVSIFSPSNTAYVAHLGGAFCGFIMMWYWRKNQFKRNRWDL